MKKKRVIVMIVSIVLISGITFVGGLCKAVGEPWLRTALMILCNLCNGAVAAAAMKITDMKADIDLKNVRQYFTGIVIALALSLVIAVIPALCGVSLVGAHQDASVPELVFSFLYFMLIIGPVEELVFRVYLQDTLVSLSGSMKYAGVVAASVIFGLWHWINGSLVQVLFAAGIGLVFGTCKYLIKDLKYPGLALGHGLYDFLNKIVRMFIV